MYEAANFGLNYQVLPVKIPLWCPGTGQKPLPPSLFIVLEEPRAHERLT